MVETAAENNISASKQKQAGRFVGEIDLENKKIHMPDTLLNILKGLYASTLIEIIYVTAMCAYYPHAGKHAIEKYITTEERTQYLLYFLTSFLMVGSILLVSAKLSPLTVTIAIALGALNLVWHAVNVVLYFLIPIDGTTLWRAVLYWLEIIPSFLIMDAAIILKLRVSFVALSEEEIRKIAPKEKKDIETVKGQLYGVRKPLFENTAKSSFGLKTGTIKDSRFGSRVPSRIGTQELANLQDIKGFGEAQNEGNFENQQNGEENRIPHMSYLDQLAPEPSGIGSRLNSTLRTNKTKQIISEMSVNNEEASDYFKSRGPRKVNG